MSDKKNKQLIYEFNNLSAEINDRNNDNTSSCILYSMSYILFYNVWTIKNDNIIRTRANF